MGLLDMIKKMISKPANEKPDPPEEKSMGQILREREEYFRNTKEAGDE